MTQRSFASDNNAGVHPDILQAIANANDGHVVAYGDDPYTQAAIEKFKQYFGEDITVYFVFNGTAANVLGLKAITESYNAVICTETSHIHFDECGAPEKFAGVKLLTCETGDGKLTIDHIKKHMHGFGDEHHIQPRVISIAQSTELGTVYSVEEIKTLADYAHTHDMLLHMDGARLANAAVSLKLPFRAFTHDAGVDVLSFGGTKNGLLGGEAVVFFPHSSEGGHGVANFKFIRKHGMQLASKMRFIAAQFDALLSNDLWWRNASNANAMAQRLACGIQNIPGITLAYPTQANAVFAVVPKRIILPLQARTFFYVWSELDDERAVVRWMCSWDTTVEDVDSFLTFVAEGMGQA